MSDNTTTSSIEQSSSSSSNSSTQESKTAQDAITDANTSIVDLEAITNSDENAKEVVDLTQDISEFIDLTKDDTSVETFQRPSGKQNRRKRKRYQPQNTRLQDDYIEVSPMKRSESTVSKRIVCPVCMDDSNQIIQDTRNLVATICGHVFCDRCLEESIKMQPKCPTCRKYVNFDEYHKLFL